MRLNKIIATIGIATNTEKDFENIFNLNVNAFRFNFSHANTKKLLNILAIIKKVAIKKHQYPTFILDTKGPEIRITDVKSPVVFKKGEKVKFFADFTKLTDSKNIYVQLDNFVEIIKKNEIILLDDGKLSVRCTDKTKDFVEGLVLNTHKILGRRKINLPNSDLKIKFLSDKDKKDLKFACDNNFSWIALSFVMTVDNIKATRKFLDNHGGKNIKICSKIETQKAIDNIKDIIQESDSVMVARGDLAIEIPYEEVPFYQSMIIKYCNFYKKPVIVATQMLESMTTEIFPTRAEISDVYFSCLLGADSGMLSGETAVGKHPVKCLKVMAKIQNQFIIDNTRVAKIEKDSFIGNFVKNKIQAIVMLKEDKEKILEITSKKAKIPLFLFTDDKKFNFNYYGFTYSVFVKYSKSLDKKEIAEYLEKKYKFEKAKISFYS